MGNIPTNISNSKCLSLPAFQIEKFCDDDKLDPDSLHNPLADNLMNIKCSERSAWSVMRDHADFQAEVPLVSNTAPEFEVLQLSSVRSVVLVLDISGSMQVSLCFLSIFLPPSLFLSPLSISLSNVVVY